jgi:hypothetical protein
MSTSIRTNLHTSLVEAFHSDITSNRNSYYYYIGKTVPWNLTDLPPEYIGSQTEDFDTKNDIVLAKKILASDVAFGINRYDWVSNTVYHQYDSTVNLTNLNFYVLTEDFNVYKCLNNNYGLPSTVKPIGTSYAAETYSDGYVWKYMYSVSQYLRNKFLSATVMPVIRSLDDQFFGNGELKNTLILNGGSGYAFTPSVTLSVVSVTGTSALIYPEIDSHGSIVKVYIKSGGTGYLQSNTTITVSGNVGATGKYGTNSSAIFTPVILNGVLDSVIINDPGLNYTPSNDTTISIVGDGSGAKITPFIDDGVIKDVIIESYGSGYTYAALTVNSTTGSGASLQAVFNFGNVTSVQSIVEQMAIDGAIHAVGILNNGTGYTVAPTVQIVGDGIGATAVARIALGSIVGIDMVTVGSGYSYATITLSGNQSATVYPILSPTGGHGKNAVNELGCNKVITSSTINNDPIHGIRVNNDFRQYGIIKNPKSFGSVALYQNQLGSTCYLVIVNNNSSIVADDIVTINTTKQFYVIHVGGSSVILSPLKHQDTISVNDTGKTISNVNFTILTVTNPDINRMSGDLQYINNQMAIEYSQTQQLTLKTIFTL